MRRTVKGLFALGSAVALAAGVAVPALADTLTNNVGGSTTIVVAPGGQAVVGFTLGATSTPATDPAGCDASGTGKVTVNVASDSYGTTAGASTNWLTIQGQGGAKNGPTSRDLSNCRRSAKFTFVVGAGTAGNTYHITATPTGGATGSLFDTGSASFTIHVVAGVVATNLTLSPSSPSIPYGTTNQVWNATLRTGSVAGAGTAISGALINFNVAGVAETATTDASGVAALTAPIGTTYSADTVPYTIDAVFNGGQLVSGGPTYATSSASDTFTITKGTQAALVISGPTTGSYGDVLPIVVTGGSGTGATTVGASGTACSLDANKTSVDITAGSGTCTLTATNPGDSNYNSTSATPVSVTIGKINQPTLSVTAPTDATYGVLSTITTSGGAGTGALSVAAASGDGCTVLTSGADAGKLQVTDAAGSCTLTATKLGDTNYNQATSAPFTVNLHKATQTPVVTGPGTCVYDTSCAISATAGAGTGTLTYTATGTACSIDADGVSVDITAGTGDCYVTAHQAADDNYAQADSAPFSVTPEKASATLNVTVPTPTYDGNTHSVSVTTTPAGLDTVTVTYDGSTTPPTHAGTYAVVVTLANGDFSATEVDTTMTIAKKLITPTFTADNKEYDGTTDAVVHAGSIASQVIGSDVVTYTVSDGQFDTKDVGNGKTVTATQVLGGDTTDYTLPAVPVTATADITPRLLTATIVADDKQYDGTDSATISSITLDRVLTGEDVSAAVDSASFDGVDAGPHTVTAQFHLVGADVANYELTSTSASAPASITQKALTVTTWADDKQYDGTTAATAGGNLGGIIGTDDVSAIADSAHFADKNVGTGKTVTFNLTLAGAQAPDYSIPANPYTATASISALHLTGSFTAASRIYNGGTAATVTGTSLFTPITGDHVVLTYTGAHFSSKNVGNGIVVTLDGAGLGGDGIGDDSGNYVLDSVSTTTANITALHVTGAFTAANRAYDGTTAATVTSTSLVTAVAGDHVVLTYTGAHFASKNVANGIVVTLDGAGLGGDGIGDDSANYVLDSVSTTTANITPATLTVKADNQSITYGDALPNPYTYKITGYVNGENATTGGVTGAPSCGSTATTSSPAGTYTITCTIGSLAATNYGFSFSSGTLSISTRLTTMTYTGSLNWPTSSATATTAPVVLQGQVSAAAGDLTKAPVVFEIFKSTNSTTTPDYTCTATVSAAGVATCGTTLGLDSWTVIMHMPSNGYFYALDSDPVVLTVYQPATDKFGTGGGWITDPSSTVSSANKHGNFGFTVRFNKSGSPSGQAVYVFRGADGYDYVIKSNSWSGGSLGIGTNTVTFLAKANVTVINRATGLAVSGLGGGNYSMRVDATDNGSGGSTDTYAITVYDGSNVVYHQAGSSSSQLILGGGNITVHTTK